MNDYTDGGSMRGSGIDVKDITWSFICSACALDNDDIDAKQDGRTIYATCIQCGWEHEGDVDD